MRRISCIALLILAAQIAGQLRLASQAGPPPFTGVLDEHPAVQYALRPTHDRISALNRALGDGAVSLTYQPRGGYLRSVLDGLRVSPESQLLVFSKTGVQRNFTDPENPRALFFDDSVVVGYIAGARLLELATQDPEQGVVFYTLDQTETAKPEFKRRGGECLTCHVSASTLEVPGLINRSTFTRADGSTIPQLGSFTVDHRTRLLDRWGGMYVTGNYAAEIYHGRKEHMGNVTVAEYTSAEPSTTSNEAFVRWLNSDSDALGYPSHESDIVSLMLFDHQTHAVNLLTRLNWESRVAAGNGRADFHVGALSELVGELTDYFLFVGEAPPPARLTPRAGFLQWFNAASRKDGKGRSLRDLDLEDRLLKYPCSYMIYSEAFDHLPAPAKDAVYQRLWTILSGRDKSSKYAHLSAADRVAIVEILRDTKQELAEGILHSPPDPAAFSALRFHPNNPVIPQSCCSEESSLIRVVHRGTTTKAERPDSAIGRSARNAVTDQK
jgi:hypothetical protein